MKGSHFRSKLRTPLIRGFIPEPLCPNGGFESKLLERVLFVRAAVIHAGGAARPELSGLPQIGVVIAKVRMAPLCGLKMYVLKIDTFVRCVQENLTNIYSSGNAWEISIAHSFGGMESFQ